MSRIVPNTNNPKQKAPAWMNRDELINASKQEDTQIQKTASTDKPNTVVTKYACDGCAKIYFADHPELKNQRRLAALKNVEADLKCPDCDGELKSAETTIATPETWESRSTASFQMEKEANYSTYADRLVVMKAMDALERFASKIGMLHANVKYQRSEHTKQAGQQNDMLNKIDCQIDWEYGRKQHARVYATIQIDPAGKILMPKVFKMADNTEHPFDKETVANLMNEVDFKKQSERQPMKTDTPTFKKPDPSNFHMASEKKADEGIEDSSSGQVNFPEPSTQNNTELLANIRSLYGDPNNTTGLNMPEIGNISDAQETMIRNILDQYNSVVDGGSQSVNPLVQQMNDVIYSSRVAWDNPNSMSFNPIQPKAPQSGVIQQTLNPQQSVYNNIDNKQYTVKQQTPQATTLVDPSTNQESVVPAGQEQYLKPVVKTTSEVEAEDEALKEQIYNDKKEQIESKKARAKNMGPRWNEIRKNFQKKLQAGSWKGSVTSGLDHFGSLPRVVGIRDTQGNISNDVEAIRYALLKGQEDLVIQFDDGTEKQACHLGGAVMMVDQEPIVIRASLAFNNEYSGDITHMPRQVQALRDMGYSPDKGDKDETGHSDHGVPMEETKKIEVGLTEFPAGKTKGKGPGYNIPFRKMDENHVKEREMFPDRDMLPIGKTPARDVKYKGPDETSPLDEVESSLMEAVGFNVTINRPDREGAAPQKPQVEQKSPTEIKVTAPEKQAPVTKPVEPKLDAKKAPSIEEYKEPEAIPVAGGKVSEAITKLQQVIQKKTEVEAAMKKALEPVQKTLAEIKKPYESDLAKQADLMRSYIDMVYDQLTQSGDHVQAYEKMIWAAVSREKAVSPTASLPQVLAEADKLDKVLSEQIRKLQAIVENKSMQMVIERFLYEFPISGTQQKKIQSADEGEENTIVSILKQLEGWIREMIPINTEVLEKLLSVEP